MNKVVKSNNISLFKASMIFVLFTNYFLLLLYGLLPLLKNTFFLNPAMYWFITGYFLFVPMYVFSVYAVNKEGSYGLKKVICALNIRALDKREFLYSLYGLLAVFVLTGLIFGISGLLTKYFGVRPLSTTPWFMEMDVFYGKDRLLLLVWLPMFFFNIVGEEMLWRGYIQSRFVSKYSWLICSLLWTFFHLPFGFDLVIMLLPIMFIIPYVYHKTQNTVTGIFIHGIFNGPVFVMVALGLIK